MRQDRLRSSAIGAFGLAVSLALLAWPACGGSNKGSEVTISPTPGQSPAAAASGPAASTAAGETASGASGFRIISATPFTNKNGLYFVGEVSNESGADAAFVSVRLTLMDGGGNVLATGKDGLEALTLLPAGRRMPFKMSMSAAPAQWADQQFTVLHDPPSDAAREENYTDFELSDVSVQANAGASGVLVQGLIKNTGAKPASRSRLVFVGRDAAGDVVAAWAANGPAALGAGASDTFAFPVLDVAVAPATYQVLVRATA